MTKSKDNNRWRRQTGARRDPRLTSMLSFSVGLHLLLVLVFGGWLVPRMQHPRPPAYVVDLVNLPVKDPQAGRPDGTPKQSVKAKPKPKAKPVVKPKPKPKPVAKPKPKPKPKPKIKPKPKPKPKVKAKATAKQPKPDYRKTESAIEKLRRKQEREALKQKLAAMQSSDTRAPGSKVPLGETTGTGKEAGVAYQTWLQQAYKSAWSLSKYQVGRLDLEAEVVVFFDRHGFLKDYKFTKESGDRRFDDSIVQAIRQVDRLEPEPGTRKEFTINFNLKDLLD